MILLLFLCFMSICGFAYANEASWDSAGVSLRSAVNVTGAEWWILGLALYSQSAIETCLLSPTFLPRCRQSWGSPPQTCPLWPVTVSYLGIHVVPD